MKTIEVDPRVPGIRDEIPFPQAKQYSPELDFPSCQFSSPFSQKLQRLQEKPIVTLIFGDLKTNLAIEMSQNNTLTHGKL